VTDILQKIIATKRIEIARAKEALGYGELLEKAQAAKTGAERRFARALIAKGEAGEFGIIAEIKKASPSKGLIRPDFCVQDIAKSYEKAGAACLSVLTDREYFQGGLENLAIAKRSASLPALRKDFIVDPYQVAEAAAYGADAILLISAVLEERDMQNLAALARELQMDVLIESHDEEDVRKALLVEDALIGVNNRDLRTFTMHLDATERLMKKIPASRVPVTESGIRTPKDVAYMKGIGVNNFLVGEAFMRCEDPGTGLRELFYGR
jgi:indole-3-glycerol phosphate synthase